MVRICFLGLLIALSLLWLFFHRRKSLEPSQLNSQRKKEKTQKTEEGIRKYNELLRLKIMSHKEEETRILRGVEDASLENLSFNTMDSRLEFNKEISLEEEPVRDEERCPSIQLSAIDKCDFRKNKNKEPKE